MNTKEHIALCEQFSARNYLPLPIVLSKGNGVWVEDVEGRRFLDMLSSYSALSQGHRHPKILAALREQTDRLCLTSRAFHHDTFAPFCKSLAQTCGFEQVLVMNTGVEAVETAIKAARRWGYRQKKVEPDQAEIIVCSGNFHGRTTAVVSFSTEPLYRDGFGPYMPGFKVIPYNDLAALEAAIGPNTVAFLVEPIQGEAGINVPAAGYLAGARGICSKHNVLLMFDEIQTGLGRTGRMFCFQYENAKPDVLIVGKALGGGCFPVSAICAARELMAAAFEPGNHGSTFGGNPLACSVGTAALRVIIEEKLVENSFRMGEYLRAELAKMNSPHVADIRGKGLLNGVEIRKESGPARPFCEKLAEVGILAKETHGTVIRLAPPLIITREEMTWAIEKIAQVLK